MSALMTRRTKYFAAQLGLAAMLALQVAVVAHGITLPAAAAPATLTSSAGDCAGMSSNPVDGSALAANLCQTHCLASAQIDGVAPFALVAPFDPPALRIEPAVPDLPASVWVEPLIAKAAAPPAQLLFARFLI